MLNKIILGGRLTADPELRYTQSQRPVASFSLACERDYAPAGQNRETDFVSIVAWNKTAEFARQYFYKGDMMFVEGRLQSRDWTDKDGNNRRSWEVIADRLYFGGSKRERAESGESGFSELSDSDGELPF